MQKPLRDPQGRGSKATEREVKKRIAAGNIQSHRVIEFKLAFIPMLNDVSSQDRIRTDCTLHVLHAGEHTVIQVELLQLPWQLSQVTQPSLRQFPQPRHAATALRHVTQLLWILASKSFFILSISSNFALPSLASGRFHCVLPVCPAHPPRSPQLRK